MEDEPAVRSVTRRMLERGGYRVLEAESGAEALRRMEEVGGEIRLLITDVVLPGMSGRELAEALWRRWPQLKVLFVSGYLDDRLMEHGIGEGTLQFLPKPLQPASLLRKVHAML